MNVGLVVTTIVALDLPIQHGRTSEQHSDVIPTAIIVIITNLAAVSHLPAPAWHYTIIL